MKNQICTLLLFVGVLISCGEEKQSKRLEIDENPNQEIGKANDNKFHDLSEEGIREKLTQHLNRDDDRMLKDSDFKFYRGQMNRDTILDWVVTVNTFDYAKKTLEDSQNMFAIDYGYIGNYNYIFVINGETGDWNGRPVGSVALKHLEIEIDRINSNQYELAKVFFRLGTSKFIAIYNSSIPQFQEIFSWEVFNLSDKKNEGRPSGNVIEFVENDKGSKDILIYEAEFPNFDDEALSQDMFSYNPEMKKRSSKPKFHFRYILSEGKYGELKK